MNVFALQEALLLADCNPGPLDGQAGARTYHALFDWTAERELGERGEGLGRGLAKLAPVHGLATRMCLAHFLGQASVETGGLRFMRELGGPTYFERYDGRLGNDRPGDGFRYRGRGIVQLTGRDNYFTYGKLLDLDLIEHPELAEQPETAVAVYALYWAKNGLNPFADANDSAAVSRGINRGNPRSTHPANHEAQRKAATDRLLAFIPA